MDFLRLVEVCEELEQRAGRIEMTDILASFLKQVPEDLLAGVILFLQGRVFPTWSDKELGIGEKLLTRALAEVAGVSPIRVEDKVRDMGDLGLVAEDLLRRKAQLTLFQEKLSVKKVYEDLSRLAELTGEKSQEKKLAYLRELLGFASPKEGKYLVRLVLKQLRLGVGEGIIRDAIAQAFGVSPEMVDRAYALLNDMGEVARVAKLRGDQGLREVKPVVGRPIRVMLAQKLDDVGKAIEEFGEVAFEIKYDGARLQIHKNGSEITLYTRRLENVTRQFPEVVESAASCVKAEVAILEGEMVAIRSESDRRPQPFQELSKRIKRKYGIEEMRRKVPVEVNLFDILYCNGRSLIDEELRERRKILEEVVEGQRGFQLAEQIITSDLEEAQRFYKHALELGHEGVMAKNLRAPYQPGRRVGYMYKIKPVMENLDLVIIGATWGEGRRAHWLASFLLGVRDPSSGKLLSIGRMGTGLTDEQFEEMTKLLKPLIVKQVGKEVEIKPEVVVEVAYEEIQRSPKYESGYALRFPRLVRIREDRSPEDADTLERVEEILLKG